MAMPNETESPDVPEAAPEMPAGDDPRTGVEITSLIGSIDAKDHITFAETIKPDDHLGTERDT
jgi:hypothetical protein